MKQVNFDANGNQSLSIGARIAAIIRTDTEGNIIVGSPSVSPTSSRPLASWSDEKRSTVQVEMGTASLQHSNWVKDLRWAIPSENKDTFRRFQRVAPPKQNTFTSKMRAIYGHNNTIEQVDISFI